MPAALVLRAIGGLMVAAGLFGGARLWWDALPGPRLARIFIWFTALLAAILAVGLALLRLPESLAGRSESRVNEPNAWGWFAATMLAAGLTVAIQQHTGMPTRAVGPTLVGAVVFLSGLARRGPLWRLTARYRSRHGDEAEARGMTVGGLVLALIGLYLAFRATS